MDDTLSLNLSGLHMTRYNETEKRRLMNGSSGTSLIGPQADVRGREKGRLLREYGGGRHWSIFGDG